MKLLLILLIALPLAAGAVTITLNGEEIKSMKIKMDGHEVSIMRLKTNKKGKIVIKSLIFKDAPDPNKP